METLLIEIRIIDENFNKKEIIDYTVTQWQIEYPIKKVLKLKKCTIDWDSVFGKDAE